MRLAELRGQDLAAAALRRAVAGGRLAHAYLFDGPPGIGKRSAALGLAMAMICPRAPGEGCGTCDTCRRVEAGLHPDVPHFATDEAQLKIETVQAILALASGRPHEAPARIVIVDDADKMNPTAANALLKTLEEPPAGTHFVLVSAAPERLLPTIRSRTQRIRFRPVAPDALGALLIARGVPAARAATAAALADGSVSRALALCSDEAGEPGWAAVSALRAAAASGRVSDVFDAAALHGGKEEKDELPGVLALLARLYRDALARAFGADDLALLGEQAADTAGLATRGPWPLRRALEAVVEAQADLRGNVNATLALERLLLGLRGVEAAPGARDR